MNTSIPALSAPEGDLYSLLVEMVGEAVLLHADDRILLANEAAALLLGAKSVSALVGMPASSFLPNSNADSAAQQRRAYPRRRGVRQLIKRLDGTPIEVVLAERPCSYQRSQATQVVIRPGGAELRAVPASGKLADADVLTDLPNRRQFCNLLQAAMDRATRSRLPVWILYVDLDHFRRVNSDHGHRVGDLALIESAERLRECIRKTDALASPGGDEFLIALEGTVNREGAGVVAARVLESLARPFYLDGAHIKLSASIGVCCAPDQGTVPEILLQHADVALWQAKSGTRGRCEFFSTAMDLQLRRSTLARALVEQRIGSLTPRESEVLQHLIAGQANKMIAYELGSSMRTIEHHRAKIMGKMHAGSLPELVRMVLERRDGG